MIVKSFPDKEPHKATISEISLPIGIFLCIFVMLLMFKIDIAKLIIEAWKPEWVEGGKYNPLAPSSILVLITWFSTSRILSWHYKKTEKLEQLKSYYLPNGEQTKSYINYGRFLFLFFFFAGIVSLVMYSWWGAMGLFLSFLPFICFEVWIRYEFEWKLKNNTEE